MTDIKIGIHPIHRRMAELHFTQQERSWTSKEQAEMIQCIQANAKLVERLDQLNNLGYIAHISGDAEWEQEIRERIDKLTQPMKGRV
ncbi:hypothetical protein ACE3MS_21425 [Paenibacillus dendritiformis]|uniref:DUF7667 family protein n=1 Tax=Paenibacillus dendritiformis TaxID=130049 RepID=UPI00366473C8